jgi:hypothetical protein
MEISTVQMPDEFELVLFGDNQEGNIASAHEKLDECIDFILSGKKRYAVHMGDAVDAFWVSDPRYHPITTTQTPLEQKNSVVKAFAPLAKAKKLLTILKGNHEKALENKAGDISYEISKELRQISKCEYPITGTYTHKLEFTDKDNRPMCKVYLTHGRKSITSVSPDPHRRKAYMQFRLKRLLENMAGDCILMARGHSHIVLVTPPIPTLYLDSSDGQIKQHYTTHGAGTQYIHPDHRWYGCTGSFLKSQMTDGIETYSEVAEYDPVELGYLVATFANRTCVDLREVKI